VVAVCVAVPNCFRPRNDISARPTFFFHPSKEIQKGPSDFHNRERKSANRVFRIFKRRGAPKYIRQKSKYIRKKKVHSQKEKVRFSKSVSRATTFVSAFQKFTQRGLTFVAPARISFRTHKKSGIYTTKWQSFFILCGFSLENGNLFSCEVCPPKRQSFFIAVQSTVFPPKRQSFLNSARKRPPKPQSTSGG